jgi:hypothetical protein
MQSKLETPKRHFLWPLSTDTTDLELVVMNWFAARHEILWIPIYEVADTPSGIADATALAERYSGPRLIRNEADFLALPLGIKGWLFPAHLDDTDVICVQAVAGEISIGRLTHPATGERISWRYNTEAPIRRQALYCRTQREL